MSLITRGNTKLGNKIWSWSLPAKTTCPGKSEACREVCYADRRRYRQPRIIQMHQQNLAVAKAPGFVERMLRELDTRKVRVLRIHGGGDFFGVRYIGRWINIVQERPSILFYAHTRAWASSYLLHSLRRLGNEPNVRLWLSGDRSMPCPPVLSWNYASYLSLNDEDVPLYPFDLVFRNNPQTKRQTLGIHRSPVCRAERSPDHEDRVTCSTCTGCPTGRAVAKWTRKKRPLAAVA